MEPTGPPREIRGLGHIIVVGPLFSDKSRVIAQNTISMDSMLMLGGLGACPPENRCSEIEFGDICESKCGQWIMD